MSYVHFNKCFISIFSNKFIEVLSFSGNNLGDTGVQHIAEAIQYNQVI